MKKYICFVLLILTIFSLCFHIPVFAEEESVQRVFDQAEILTENEEKKLQEKITSMRSQTKMDFVIVTVNSTDGKETAVYADDFYDENSFGEDEKASGALFLIDMEHHEAYITTTGNMIRTLTDERLEHILDKAYEGLSEADFYQAASAFLTETNSYIEADKALTAKKPASTGNYDFHAGVFIVGILISCGIGGIVCLIISRKYKNGFQNYRYPFRENSHLTLHIQNDRLVSSRVSQKYIPPPPPTAVSRSSSPGNSGRSASSTHTSSSGRTHGGAGRSFRSSSTHTSRSGKTHGGGGRKF